MASLQWYYRFVANRPGCLLLIVGAVMAVLALLLAYLEVYHTDPKERLDFTDPALGFETRRTDIADASITYEHIDRPSGRDPPLMRDPDEVVGRAQTELENNRLYDQYAEQIQRDRGVAVNRSHHMFVKSDGGAMLLHPPEVLERRRMQKEKQMKQEQQQKQAPLADVDVMVGSSSAGDDYEAVFDERDEAVSMDQRAHKTQHHPVPADSVHNYCGSPTPHHARIVFQRTRTGKSASNDSLLRLDALLAMCDALARVRRLPAYKAHCEPHSPAIPAAITGRQCCHEWSLPGYVALLAGLDSCRRLRAEHVHEADQLLHRCLPAYLDGRVRANCWDQKCPEAADECTHNNAVYNVLHFLVDVRAFERSVSWANETTTTAAAPLLQVSAAMAFLPVAQSYRSTELFDEMQKADLSGPVVSVVAMDLGAHNSLFDQLLVRDIRLIVLGGVLIVLCLWIYTQSFLLTVATLLAIEFSLLLAFIVYRWVLMLKFFPFMNLLAVVVSIGIGADDVFIYISAFRAERTKTAMTAAERTELTRKTLRHAFAAIGITSFTTAFAFFVSVTNAITTIKCFAIFAGLTVACNFCMMMTWIPAAVAFVCNCEPLLNGWCEPWAGRLRCGGAVETGKNAVTALVAWTVTFRWLPVAWLAAFGVLFASSAYVVFGHPGFRLSTSQHFSMFRQQHPFEVYRREFGQSFAFERTDAAAGAATAQPVPEKDDVVDTDRVHHALFVWGVHARDNGSAFDPLARGSLLLDDRFDAYAPETQLWLHQFCQRLREQPFFHSAPTASAADALLSSGCFLDSFAVHMNRTCREPMTNVDLTPCCQTAPFPFAEPVYRQCLPDYVHALRRTPRSLRRNTAGGPLFGRMHLNRSIYAPRQGRLHVPPKPPAQMLAFIVDVNTRTPLGATHAQVAQLYAQVRQWFEAELSTAPKGMRNAFVHGDWQLYDLQRALYADTGETVVWSLAVAFAVVLLVTGGDLLVGVFVCASIAMTICGTLAVLVLLGWRLNVLESIAMGTSIGLSVDCSLHYALEFQRRRRLLDVGGVRDGRRQLLSAQVLRHMVGPTSMAALTTGLAGLCMLPSQVLPYIQMGQLLVALMLMSWAHATFFLMSALQLLATQRPATVSALAAGVADGTRRWWQWWWSRARVERAVGYAAVVVRGNNDGTDGTEMEPMIGGGGGAAATGGSGGGGAARARASVATEMESLSGGATPEAPDGCARSRTIESRIAEMPLDVVPSSSLPSTSVVQAVHHRRPDGDPAPDDETGV